MWRTFIQITALCLTLGSAFFLIKGVLFMPTKDIAQISSTYWNYNSNLVKNMTGSRADTIVGFFILLISFLFQMINSLWPMRIGDFEVNKTGVVLGMMVSFLIVLVSYKTAGVIQSSNEKQVIRLLEKK